MGTIMRGNENLRTTIAVIVHINLKAAVQPSPYTPTQGWDKALSLALNSDNIGENM